MRLFPIGDDTRLSYIYLLKWVALSLVAGAAGAALVRAFVALAASMVELLPRTGLPMVVWPLIGAAVAGGLIYRLQPHAAGEGIPSYIRGLRLHGGELPFSVTFFKFWAALATIGTLGNGGIVGPLGRVTAGLVSALERLLARLHAGFGTEDRRTAAICGLAATVGAIFHAPVGGGIFAVEIIQRAKLGYKDLFPAILSSATAVFLCKTVGWDSFYRIRAVYEFMDVKVVGYLFLLSVAVGFAGSGFTLLYAWTVRLMRRQEGNVLVKVLAGSLAAALLARVVNPELMGTSNRLVTAVMTGDPVLLAGNLLGIAPLPLALAVVLLVKAIGNCVTVGSGMSAGFTGPVALIGMMIGALAAGLLGIPAFSATYCALVAAGFSGMLASSMNIPLAAAVMTIEVFGLQYSFPAALAAVVGFQVARHRTLYGYALAGAGLAVDE